MARPRYIICSESQSVDQVTGSISHFNVVEKLGARVPASPEVHVHLPPIKVWLSAVWMRDENDGPDDEFEFELSATMPGRTPQLIQKGFFTFGSAMFSRFQAEITLGPPGPDVTPGLILFESRVRKKGAAEWMSQQFPIPLEIERVDKEGAASSA